MRRYREWSRVLEKEYPAVYELSQILPYTSIPSRKCLLTQIRCQVSPEPDTRLYIRMRDQWNVPLHLPEHLQDMPSSLLFYARRLRPYLSPILAGFLSMLVRMAPYDNNDSMEEVLQATIRKEIQASITTFHPTTLEYAPIFSSDLGERCRRVHANLPLDPVLHSEIHKRFSRTKHLLRQRLIYPKLSKKTIGERARRNAASTFESVQWSVSDPETGVDIEKIYHESGFLCSGETEMRWAWKYNNLNPRVYFAQGPDQSHHSKYIQAVMNVLVDAFPNVHTFLRHLPSLVPGSPEYTAFIYDYESFTSGLEEIQNFTDALADFFSDTTIHVVDTFLGVIAVNLGDLIKRYNDACNRSPDFDASKVLGQPDIVLTHTCGMLGVPGNITSCTLLHGIHLALIMGSLHNNKVVGDDAFGKTNITSSNTKDNLFTQLGNIGRVSLSKMEFWPPHERDNDASIRDTWHYVKRPITRIDEHMEFGDLVDWPGIDNILSLQDDYHTSPSSMANFARVKKFLAQAYRLLVQVESMGYTDMEYLFIRRFLRSSYEALDIPLGGGLEYAGRPLLIPSCSWRGDIVGDFINEHYDDIVEIPLFASPGIVTVEPQQGAQFEDRSRPVWRILSDLGYLDRELLTHHVVVSSSIDLVKQVLSKSFAPCYAYTFLKTPPSWIKECVQYVPEVLLSPP